MERDTEWNRVSRTSAFRELGTVLSSTRAREECEQGEQISYDEIYVWINTGISDIEQELEEDTVQESRT